VTGQAILNAAEQWIGKTSYCWDAGNENGPTHGKGDDGEAPDCTNPATTGFDCSGLAIYAIYAAGGPDLFAKAHGPSLSSYGTAVSESAMQVGDIISFNNGQHFAIYAGGSNVVQADTAVSFTGGGWKDGVSEIPLRWLTADLTITGVRRFS
jgi:cell wall-associated NlpC family hydrolase